MCPSAWRGQAPQYPVNTGLNLGSATQCRCDVDKALNLSEHLQNGDHHSETEDVMRKQLFLADREPVLPMPSVTYT
jgi:hypothetical protein